MSDTASRRILVERRVRKVPAIVVDRPPLEPARVVLGLIVGVIVGLVLGFLMWLLLRTGGTEGSSDLFGHSTGFFGLSFLHPYVGSTALLGLLAGTAWGLLYGRTVSPRRDVVEVEVPVRPLRRRRSASTALERRS